MVGFQSLQIQLIIIFLTIASTTSSSAPSFQISKPNCPNRCGNVSIPFPFGTRPDCYQEYSFLITCNRTFTPHKPFLQNTSIEITDITLDGQLRLLQYIAHDCYDRNRTRISYGDPWINLPTYLTVNNTANKFTIIGCDTYGFVSGRRLNRDYQTGCTAMCDAADDLAQGSCTGLGCCQTSIPKEVWRVELTLKSYENYSYVWGFNNCSYAFVVEESAFTFSPENLTNLRDVDRLPMVIDWAIGNGTCEEARMNATAYACKSVNSVCYKPSNGYGYRCSCKDGYQGNPYLQGGCQDIDECLNTSLNICEKKCVNTPGGFQCVCPEGYSGDGRTDGKGCIRDSSALLIGNMKTGIALGVIVLLLGACWLHLGLKRRNQMKMRQKFFVQNGGIMLQEQLIRREPSSSDTAKIFTAFELQNATDNFNNSKIIGQGGYGTVYKGLLPDNRIVAIKKSKEVDPNQIEQFINETQVPLLVYEFISNGTLYEHVHNKAKARSLSWDVRLKIATETAGVLSYLHSSASTPIIHRDVKSANILLDHTYTAKVSDFGASKLVPLDQTQLSTMVQGTFGYLDPEYMQTNQLTEKSDVYSFGVVLIELLTGMRALSYDRPEEERNLANFFISVMKQNRLFQVLEDNVAKEENKERVMKVAELARICLNVKGDDRPSMKEVAMELEGLIRVGVKHAWVEFKAEDMESLLGDEFSSFTNSAGNSTSIGFDSLKDQIIMPRGGTGR
ncbi:wall-associated receptor kinase 2 [Phtheirospermum japonicum]|uniref:Wall-associated receptor kinase 2 n=1 Tax=Phtheirospermum japonicum TaxID=374723 RepID=A0A830B2C7_9LAMI|nr:wall-associated receptor kinase 2 [Phtheirospermum japonicum]